MRENHKVRKHYRKHMLAQICTLPEEKFGKAFGMQTIGPKPDDYYHFRDNDSRVLAVAHLDTVVARNRRAATFHKTDHGPMVVSGALDDRLGAYVILGLLPRLGVKCDVLLTVGEELGQSTAGLFIPPKKYDWIIEFDRAGTDVVTYQYDDGPSRRAVEAVGAEIGLGSFSDISYLEHVGVKAFNWGVGYGGNYHSEAGYAYLDDTFAMVAKYLRFHKRNAGTTMHHAYEPVPARIGSYWAPERNSAGNCETCLTEGSVDPDTFVCSFCKCCDICGKYDQTCRCWAEDQDKGYWDSVEDLRRAGWKDDNELNGVDKSDAALNSRALELYRSKADRQDENCLD